MAFCDEIPHLAARETAIIRGAVSPDHIHMLVSREPTLGPAKRSDPAHFCWQCLKISSPTHDAIDDARTDTSVLDNSQGSLCRNRAQERADASGILRVLRQRVTSSLANCSTCAFGVVLYEIRMY